MVITTVTKMPTSCAQTLQGALNACVCLAMKWMKKVAAQVSLDIYLLWLCHVGQVQKVTHLTGVASSLP